MPKKMKETMTVDIKGFSAPFGDPSKKGKKRKKPWYLQDDDSLKESLMKSLARRKMVLSEAQNDYERMISNVESGSSLNSLIRFNKDVLFRIFSKDEADMDAGEKALMSKLRSKYGDKKIDDKIAKVRGISGGSEEKKPEAKKAVNPNQFFKYRKYFDAAEEESTKEGGRDLTSRGEFADWLIDTFPEIKSSADAKPIAAAWELHLNPDKEDSEDVKREKELGRKHGEEHRRELASRLAVSGEKVKGVEKELPGQKSPSREREKFHLSDIAMGMAAEQGERALPTWSQIDGISPNFAAELAQAYQRKVGRSIPKDFSKWATVFNKKVVDEIRAFKQEHGIKVKKFDPGTIRARGANFSKPRIKQKNQKRLKDPSVAGKPAPRKKFSTIDAEIAADLRKKGQVDPSGEPRDEMGLYIPGTAERTLRNVIARYDLSTIADDDLFDRRVRVFAKQNNMNPQRLFDFIEVFNRMKDDEERGELKKASEYFAEMDISPWSPMEQEIFHDFLDEAESAYPIERMLKAKMEAPDDSEEGLKILNAPVGQGSFRGLPGPVKGVTKDIGRKYVSRAKEAGVENSPTKIEDLFGDVLKKHWGHPDIEDLGFRNPKLKNLMFKIFKDAASSRDIAIIPKDLLPVKAFDEDGNSIVIRTVPELVRFTTGGQKGSSRMADQFEEFLIDFANDYPNHFAALKEKTNQVAKRIMPQEMEEDEAIRAKESGVKDSDRRKYKKSEESLSFRDLKGFSSPVSSYRKRGTFDRPPYEEDLESDIEKLSFGDKASEVGKLSKAGVYKGRDLSSLKSLMGKFIGKGSSGPSNKDLEEIEGENDGFDLGSIVKKASDEAKFDVSRLYPRAIEKSPLVQRKRERRDKLGDKYGFGKLGIGGKRFEPTKTRKPVVSGASQKPAEPDFDFEDIHLSPARPEKPSVRFTSQDVEDRGVMRAIDTLAKVIASERNARGERVDPNKAIKAFEERMLAMGRLDMDVMDELENRIEEEKFKIELGLERALKAHREMFEKGEFQKAYNYIKSVYDRLPSYLQKSLAEENPAILFDPMRMGKKKNPPERQKEVWEESLSLIDGFEFIPTAQKNKGWENVKLSKTKKFEPTAPSLKKTLQIILLGNGEGEDCDD